MKTASARVAFHSSVSRPDQERELTMTPTREQTLWMYQNMVTSRRFEESIEKIYLEGKTPAFNMANGPIPGEMHLSNGQGTQSLLVFAHISNPATS